MKEIKVNELTDNLFETISKEWMLVTAGTKDKFNTMTANWGGAGFLWNRPVAFIFIRPERYTFDFIEQNDYLTLSFLGEEHKEIHKICGSKSGRDMDKVKATGLSPLFTENGSITFEQARLTFECKKLYADLIKPGNFIDTITPATMITASDPNEEIASEGVRMPKAIMARAPSKAATETGNFCKTKAQTTMSRIRIARTEWGIESPPIPNCVVKSPAVDFCLLVPALVILP